MSKGHTALCTMFCTTTTTTTESKHAKTCKTSQNVIYFLKILILFPHFNDEGCKKPSNDNL